MFVRQLNPELKRDVCRVEKAQIDVVEKDARTASEGERAPVIRKRIEAVMVTLGDRQFSTIKLAALDKINAHKRKLAAIYQAELSDAYVKPVKQEDYLDVFHIYAIRHPKRDQLRTFLSENGIHTEVHYPVAPNRQLAMRGILDMTDTPIAQEIHETILSLPISFFHTEDDIRQVVGVMNRF